MNKIHLIGNLTRDPEFAVTASGIATCNFTVAVNRRYKSAEGERQTDFFNCKAWRKLADTISKYLTKGSKVSVVGSVAIDSYEDAEGVKRRSFTVIVEEIEFLSSTSAENTADSAINDKFEEESGDIPL